MHRLSYTFNIPVETNQQTSAKQTFNCLLTVQIEF